MLSTARTFTLDGVEARPVRVEVDVGSGLPAFGLVGLADTAVRESRERVRSALENSGYKFPMQRITASLAPADMRKSGPGLDLALAAGLLAATEQLGSEVLARVPIAGELALDGSVRGVAGALVMAEAAAAAGAPAIGVAAPSAPEASLARGIDVLPIERLTDLESLCGGSLRPFEPAPVRAAVRAGADLARLRGQPGLRRAIEIAAAGGHGLLVVGPPGAGKSMASRAASSVLPLMSEDEAIDVARVASAVGNPIDPARPIHRPYRAPHHSISPAGLIGGGSPPRAGELTRAHRGLLFLDELAEFPRPAIEGMREPLEEGRVRITRVSGAVELPCAFQMIAATNPCGCGFGEDSPRCVCTPGQIAAYRAKLSGAFADRIDLAVAVTQPDSASLGGPEGEGSASVLERTEGARARQRERGLPGGTNACLPAGAARALCELTGEALARLDGAHERLGLSARANERVIRVARTIADLGGSERVQPDHLIEALSYRARGG